MENGKDKKANEPHNPKVPEKLEEEDFYFNEDGLMVFTSTYLLKRGYCCKNKCRNCPYHKW